MIEAGEHSGKLGDVLERLADFTESRESLRTPCSPRSSTRRW